MRDDGAGDRRRLRSAVAFASVERVRAGGERILREHFTAAEAALLGRRHPRTTAGVLAATEALALVWSATGAARSSAPGDFELTHDERGAPVLVAAPPAAGPRGRVVASWISIAHTRELAYGLAVVDLDPGGCACP